MKTSECQNYLIDENGKRVAELEETVSDSENVTCVNCNCGDAATKTCLLQFDYAYCSSKTRKDGKNGYWKRIRE